MAIIPLRTYNREIEGMIDNGQLDEAVAHCRHILATFPKHLATYRLLGKAHLEQQRISDATDIFLRVLTAIPDDFISNVGMSIIREDENNLDAAIWHMELAYEAQPANVAIQDELRRLYGRRDGTQPAKVRLTRGALARMYAKGGLYDQAIAELRAAIAEDPNRPDLQQLLAQMFYQASQRVEAVEISVNLLKKIPMCLEANRILAVSLPVTEGSDAVKNYRQMVISMDPYYAFAEPDAISSDQVPENAVNIERLEWKSGLQIGETPNQPAWATSLGISMENPTEESIPDWLKSAEAPAPGASSEKTTPSVSPFIWDTQEVEKIITDTSKPEGDIPDWMKDAGWKPASGETPPPGEETKPQEPFVERDASDELENAELPDWLSGIAPQGVVGEQKPDGQPSEEEPVNPWLEPHQPGPTDSIIQWLEEKKPESPATPASLGKFPTSGLEEEIPDWLKDLDVPQTTASQVGTPAQPTPEFTSQPSAFTEEPASPETIEVKASGPVSEEAIQPGVEGPAPLTEAVLPAELSEGGLPAAVNIDEIPDWLKEIAGEMPAEEAFASEAKDISTEASPISEHELSTDQTPALEGAATTDILAAGEGPLPQVSAETGATIQAAPTPAATEEVPISEQASIPDEVSAVQPAETAEAQPVVELPLSAESQPLPDQATIAEETPETEPPAVAEALPEAGTPAPGEELITGEATSISPPLPSTQLPASEAEGFAQEFPEKAELIPSAEISDFTEELPEAEGLSISEKLAKGELPAADQELPESEGPSQAIELPQVEQPVAVEGESAPSEPSPAGPSDEFAWLTDLIGEQPTSEELIPPTPEGEIPPPEWVKLEGEPMPEKSLELEPQADDETPALPAEEIPEWIRGLGEEPATEAATELPASTSPVASDVDQSEGLLAWQPEIEQPVKEIKTPYSPTGALEWKEDELPEWLKEITETEPTDTVPASMQPPTAEQAPVAVEFVAPEEPTSMITKELLAETPAPTDESQAVEIPVTPEELHVTEATSHPEEQTPIEEPTTVEYGMEAEAPAIQAESMPDWLKGLGEPSEIERIAQEPVSTPITEAETAQSAEIPLGLQEQVQPGEDIKPPVSPTGALEWKEEELPAWLKEITETIPEEAAATIEGLPMEDIPALAAEPSPAPMEGILPAIEMGEKAVEGSQPETGAWVAEVEKPVEPAAVPIEAEAEPATLIQEGSKQSDEVVSAAPVEEVPAPVKIGAEDDQTTFEQAQTAISKGQPSQAVGLYTELIKHHYHLDEIIKDLQEALYRFPVDIELWVSLGDAHYHSDQLQEALNAYTKAEELVR